MRAGIAFGSNLGDRLHHLRQARAGLLASTSIAAPILASGIYLTSPVDCPAGSGSFYNAVMEVELLADPLALLHELRAIESALGRSRATSRNSPRTIDLDILYAGDVSISTESLTLPHPRITQRRFVLEPLAAIRPALILPGQSEPVSQLLAKLPLGDTAHRLEDTW